MKHLLLLGALAINTLAAVAAPKATAPKTAAPAHKAPAKAVRVTLNYCPISGEKLPAKKLGATTYKGYNIAFCCPGCPEEFAGLSAKDKDAKIAKIVAKQAKDTTKKS